MKEIGKLLELLNDYEDVKTWYATYTTRGEESERKIKSDYMFDEDQNIIQIYIISKDFGFIKWLVENDKIDTSKANYKNLNGYEIELRIRAVKELVADSEEKTVLYLNLLMLLAIQDEPIRFLCEIIK